LHELEETMMIGSWRGHADVEVNDQTGEAHCLNPKCGAKADTLQQLGSASAACMYGPERRKAGFGTETTTPRDYMA
jgi:hypothetical protein